MRVLLQRVSSASASIDGAIVGQIERGLVALVGIGHEDTPDIVERMATKVVGLRIFEDEHGKMNRALQNLSVLPGAQPGMLVVSQFTLYADIRKGRRPSFTGAAPPDVARPLVDHFANFIRSKMITVAAGVFGAQMTISLVNDGPVTIWVDSADF